MLTLHARTRTQMYSGQANWDEIAAVVAALEIPVIGNGDVWTGEDAMRMKLHTNCAGIMIARGSHGAPWIFAQARAALERRAVPPAPGVAERFQIVLEHAREAIAFRESVAGRGQEGLVLREFRKHLGWYTRGLPSGKQLREALFRVVSLREAEALLEGYLAAAVEPVAA